MNKKLNRKKFFIFENLFLIRLILLALILFSSFAVYLNINKIKYFLINNINLVSLNFNYNLTSYNVTGLHYVNEFEINKIVRPYLNSSVFLLPLKKISILLKENNWIESVKLSIDLKNQLNIEIKEFEPIGIYSFNNKYYYFNSNGKIIDFVKVEDSKRLDFIIFSEKNSITKATLLIDVLKKYNNLLRKKVLEAKLIQNRRWNIILQDDILLMLPEKNIEEALNNYMLLTSNINDDDLFQFKIIDLRNSKKAVITYK